jgi:hypothetical protein
MCICAFVFREILYFSKNGGVEHGGGLDYKNDLIKCVHINFHGIQFLNKNLKKKSTKNFKQLLEN